MEHALGRQDETEVKVEMECLICGARTTVELSADKFRELSVSWKIRLLCEACQEYTEWTLAQPKVETAGEQDFWEWIAATAERFEPEADPPPHERREKRRVDLNVRLRISAKPGDEEEVTSNDISRNGFSFSSSRDYEPGQSIGVTLDMPGAQGPIIKTATVVRASGGGNGKIAYGVRLKP